MPVKNALEKIAPHLEPTAASKKEISESAKKKQTGLKARKSSSSARRPVSAIKERGRQGAHGQEAPRQRDETRIWDLSALEDEELIKDIEQALKIAPIRYDLDHSMRKGVKKKRNYDILDLVSEEPAKSRQTRAKSTPSKGKPRKKGKPEPAQKGRDSQPHPQKKSLRKNLADALFYAGILSMVVATIYYQTKTKGPIMIFDHSIMTVLTTSMQSVIPKGSLVLVQKVDPKSLKIGDDITYMKNANTSITHRIIDIFEDFEATGERGFQTKGVNNSLPDSGVVYAGHVVGKVKLHVPKLGAALSFVSQNLYVVFIMFGLLMVLSFSLRGLLSPSEPELAQPKRKKKRKASNGKLRISVLLAALAVASH
jgi:signal peptidase